MNGIPIQAGDTITYWGDNANAVVGDKFHERTTVVTTVKENPYQEYFPLIVEDGTYIGNEQTICINKARTGTLRKFKLVTSGDQLATSAQKSSAAFKSVLKKNAEAMFGCEGAELHLERSMLNIPDAITCQTKTDTNEMTKAKPNITTATTQMKCNWNDGKRKCNRVANAKCSQRMCKSHCQQT